MLEILKHHSSLLDGQRKKREVPRARRQSDDYDEKEFETDAEEGKAESETEGDNVTSKPAEEKPDFNPENPYHVSVHC